MQKTIMHKHITVMLCKTHMFYDIILLGETSCLEKAGKQYNSESTVIKQSVFDNRPCLVLDTFTELEDAIRVYNDLEEMI